MTPAAPAAWHAAPSVMAWCAAVASLTLFAIFVYRSVRLLRPGGAAKDVQCEFAVSLRSAVVYVALALPPLLLPCEVAQGALAEMSYSWSQCPESPYAFIPTNFMRVYHWLPFWYAFVVTTNIGDFLSASWQSVVGTGIAVSAVSLMNFLMPGGAGRADDPEYFQKAWLPCGYSASVALFLGVAFVYATCVSRQREGAKAYALCIFSSLLIPFMNPDHKTGFRVLVLSLDLEFNWNGAVMCDVYMVLLSIVLAAFALGANPCSRSSIKQHSALDRAGDALQDLARDTEGCLEWLVSNFCQDTWNFDTESLYFHVRQLGATRSGIEPLIVSATWECLGPEGRAQLQLQRELATLLRHFRQVLRIEIAHVRSLRHLQLRPCMAQVSVFMDEFLEACGGALAALAKSCCEPGGADLSMRLAATESADRADEALARAMQEFGKVSSSSARGDGAKQQRREDDDDAGGGDDCGAALEAALCSGGSAAELAFLDRLRSWPSQIKACLGRLDEPPAVSRAPDLPSGERHWYAFRNTISWTLALSWSVYKRSFSSGCVVGTSLIFSATSGSSFDKNINRMLGVGMGLAFGSLPAMLCLQGAGVHDRDFGVPRILVYFVVMFLMWVVAMYGYLASNSRYSYACLLWVGYAGVQMISHIPSFDDRAQGLFMDVIDNFLSCLIVFLVDMLFAYLTGASTSNEVTKAVCQCVHEVAVIVEGFAACKVTTVNIDRLEESIKRARFWDSETRHEGLVWTRLWDEAYKADSVPALLDHCDEVYVAVYAIQASAQRCGKPEVASKIVEEMLCDDLALPERCLLYEAGTRELLRGSLSAGTLEKLAVRPSGVSPSAAGALHRKRRCLIQAPSAAASGGSEPLEAAALALRLSCISLRLALQRIGDLLHSNSALLSREWRAPMAAGPRRWSSTSTVFGDDAAQTASALERQTSSASAAAAAEAGADGSEAALRRRRNRGESSSSVSE
eukprot:TRINITY_DN7678_c0_g1_i3.p1 TRINITY_DN7678_c0_g1~~TRINITY_DN7678_c0_g1_i3.p1  ORF type:complete len:969 (+),score=213.43 TRINITY_DN7678_c0_g1_i3:55-2961(+)